MKPDSFSLASNQLDIWHDQAANPDSPLYNMGGYLCITGEISYSLLNQAINQLVKENIALRLSFYQNNNEICQSCTQFSSIDLEFHDFSQHKEPSVVTRNWLNRTFKQPFSLVKDNLLWHFVLIKQAHDHYYLMTKFHHLIADGWTTHIIITRLAELYNALLQKRNPAPPAKVDYCDFLRQEQLYFNSEQFHKDAQYWKDIFPSLAIPLIQQTKNSHSLPKANIYRFHINRSFYEQLNQFSVQNHSTIYHVFITALALYFSRITQQDHIVIGAPSLNRSGTKFKQVLGLFMGLSPISLSIDCAQSSRQLLKLCARRIRNTYRHQRYPLSLISKRLELIKSGRNSLFDIVISYEKQEYSSAFGDAYIRAHQQFSGIARYPLAITICEFNQQNDVEIVFEGAETTFSYKDLGFLSERLSYILQQIMSTPDVPLKKIDLLPETEKQFLSPPLKGQHSDDPTIPVIYQFEQQAERFPQAIAIESENEQISYYQLNQRSNQLANQLISLHSNKTGITAICMPRSPEMMIAILAILKTGAAYLPIDPNTPIERIAIILKQARVTHILSLKSLRKQLSLFENNVLFVDVASQFPLCSPNVSITEHDVAYIIYTSGSTGQPKGVALPHAALSRRIAWMQRNFNMQTSDRIAQTIQFNFDPSLIEIFLAFTQGATLILAPENYQTPKVFTQFIINRNIHFLALVPSSLRLILQGLKTHQRTALKVVCCGGEVLPPELAEQFFQQTNAQLFNVYGPTEATLFATAYRYQKSNDSVLPIGQPISNTYIYIFDQYQQALPIGVTGEIVIGGSALAVGYLADQNLTQEKFISDPYNTKASVRLYRTGDLGYMGANGQLYFTGRIDRQVKISGYRIELGEIEALLYNHSEVINAAAVVFQQKIYAYIATKNVNNDRLIQVLSKLLRSHLPLYMQVTAIIPIATIPHTDAGKIDYVALPTPKFTKKSQQILPSNILEADLIQLWQSVLKSEQMSINDNFFELGGDSLAAVRLMQKIEQLTGYKHSLSLLLQHPTIQQQADYLSSELPLQNHPILRTLSENTSHSITPFYLAASGKGDSLRFKRLATWLEDLCVLHMLHPADHHQYPGITQLATEYAEIILSRNEAPGYIGGFSIGGFAALETARILAEKGKPPLGVLLLDTLHPRWPLTVPVPFRLLNHLIISLRLNKLSVNGSRLNIMLTDPGITIQLNAVQTHTVKRFDGSVALLTSCKMHPKAWLFANWYKLYGSKLQHYNVAGFHGSIFQEHNINSLSIAIRQFMKIG